MFISKARGEMHCTRYSITNGYFDYDISTFSIPPVSTIQFKNNFWDGFGLVGRHLSWVSLWRYSMHNNYKELPELSNWDFQSIIRGLHSPSN